MRDDNYNYNLSLQLTFSFIEKSGNTQRLP